MKILEVKSLKLPEVKVIKFARFTDNRGYFTEIFRRSDLNNYPHLEFFQKLKFSQCNESHSQKGTVRGLHFQWNPCMGKLVRTIHGHMVDMVVDIRKKSPNYGKIICYEMPSFHDQDFDQWIWVPIGFAHGNYYLEETSIEYFCSAEYSPNCEAGISPLAKDIDWSLCETNLKEKFESLKKSGLIISDKDKNGLTLEKWKNDSRSKNFIY